MALKTDYNSARMLRDINLEMEASYAVLIEDMITVCKKFLADTRGQLQDHAAGTYIDRTKQLRGSLAAYIFRNGQLIWHDGGQNDKVSRAKIAEKIQLTSSGFDIIGIASKEYASWVESKGYNVITRQGDTFYVDLGKAFFKLQSNSRLKILS